MFDSAYTSQTFGVLQKLGCSVPQVFSPGFETETVVRAFNAGLCAFTSDGTAKHHLRHEDGTLVLGVVLTARGRDENTAFLNASREGYRKPPYRAAALTHSRIRLE